VWLSVWSEGADLHMAQLMPLRLTVSCFSKIRIGFTFLVPAHLGIPGKRAVKRVCVCVFGEAVLRSSPACCACPCSVSLLNERPRCHRRRQYDRRRLHADTVCRIYPLIGYINHCRLRRPNYADVRRLTEHKCITKKVTQKWFGLV